VDINHDDRDDRPKVVMLRPDETEAPVLNPCDECPTFDLVQKLRGLLQESLLQPRQELHQACVVIAADPSTSVERVAAAFFHGLGKYARRRMVFFNTRATGVSAGERWLARLLQVLSQGDEASARYLVESTIEPQGRRWMLFLARELATHVVTPADETSQECFELNSKENGT
jgi:hypothetical protein